MDNRLFVGIDTSNYTTSLAAANGDGKIVANVKRLLPVKDGERGLRQSDAVFAHVKQLPELIDLLNNTLSALGFSDSDITAVCYSSSPRDADGSYMPCFLVGEAIAHSLTAFRNVPLFSSSHQQGHIMAALYSSDSMDLLCDRFAAFHVSGGTTDILLCEPDDEKILLVNKIGGTLDINAGQAIDRAGVMMGLHFPAGAELEKIAINYSGKRIKVHPCVNGLNCNLSGLENKAEKLFSEEKDINKTASYVFGFVSETLYQMSENLRGQYPDIPIVYAGGVMSSTVIRNKLSIFNGRHAEPAFSSDNAAGCALLCREKYLRGLK